MECRLIWITFCLRLWQPYKKALFEFEGKIGVRLIKRSWFADRNMYSLTPAYVKTEVFLLLLLLFQLLLLNTGYNRYNTVHNSELMHIIITQLLLLLLFTIDAAWVYV